MSSRSDVTTLLQRWRGKDPATNEALAGLVYTELHRLAACYMRDERPGHTLQTTALVHEAFMALTDAEVDWQDRAHFYVVAARQMRRILVDHARHRGRQRRGGEHTRIALDKVPEPGEWPDDELLDLDRALQQLGRQDERTAQVVELHFFAGLKYAEIARCLDLSEATIDRSLRLGKAWLHQAITA